MKKTTLGRIDNNGRQAWKANYSKQRISGENEGVTNDNHKWW